MRRSNPALLDSDLRMYFPTKTQDAIIQYNESTDASEREQIYLAHIQYPLHKLAENVINRFKFPYIQQTQTFEETKAEVVSYLVMNLSKYTQDKGKAFSYFSVIAKNYLILHNNNAYKQQKRAVSFFDADLSNMSMEETLPLEAPDDRRYDDMHEFVGLMTEYWEVNAGKIFRKKRDREISLAVIELLRGADGIENFNKKALYVMIREITGCKTSYITKVVNRMRAITLDHLREFTEYGTVGRNSIFRGK